MTHSRNVSGMKPPGSLFKHRTQLGAKNPPPTPGQILYYAKHSFGQLSFRQNVFTQSVSDSIFILCYSGLGIPVMRFERAARPCALNFRLAALKCRFGRPPNALSSVGVWPSMPPLRASFIQNVITLTGHLFIGKKCGVSKHSYLSINLKLFR